MDGPIGERTSLDAVVGERFWRFTSGCHSVTSKSMNGIKDGRGEDIIMIEAVVPVST